MWPDQGDIGSCVGQDGAIVMEITNTLRALHESTLKVALFDLSAGWLYHWSRHYADIPSHIEGSTNLGLMKALNKRGTASEVKVPTDNVAPWGGIDYSPEDVTHAKSFAIDSYWNVNLNPNDMKAAIYGLTHRAPYDMPDGSVGKIPLVTAYMVFESFKEAYDDGIVPMNKPNDKYLGGHSSAIIGWKIIDDEEYWINFNSWGSDVGDGGLFYIPKNYGGFYPQDLWLVHNGPPMEEPDPVPSLCVYGVKVANALNWIAGRKGRYYYANPRR